MTVISRIALSPVVALIAVVLIAVVLLVPAASLSAADWRSARGDLDRAVKFYLRTVRGTPTAVERDTATDDVVASLERALAPELGPPGLVARIRAILPLTESLAPELYPGVHAALSRQISTALESLPADSYGDYVELVRDVWKSSGKSRRSDRGEIARIILGSHLTSALRRALPRGPVYTLIGDLFRQEVKRLGRAAAKPLPLSAAVAAATRQPEEPTIYVVLRAFSSVHELALREEDPNRILDPMVVDIIDGLRRSEVRVKGLRKGEVLDPDHELTVAQSPLWYRLSDLIQRWTGEPQPRWAGAWEEYWNLYYGKNAAQGKFDYRTADARFRDIHGSGTTVRRKKRNVNASFFGIESRTTRVLLIVDVSGSMQKNDQNVDRLEGLRQETIQFIRQLRPGSQFNILPFSSHSDIRASLSGGHGLLKKTVPKGQISKETRAWIQGLESGGATRVDLAFRAAFEANAMDPRNTAPRTFRPGFREIYFIADGSPTDRTGVLLPKPELDDLLTMIQGLNARHRVIIHTIAFPRMASTFLRRLARENGGVTKVMDRQLLQH